MKLGIIGSGMIVKDFFHMVGEIPEIEVNAILGTKESISILKKLQIQNNVKEIYTDFEKFITLAGLMKFFDNLPVAGFQ